MKVRHVQIPDLQGATYDGKPAPGWTSYTVFKCSLCKRIRQSTSPHTTGYGVDAKRRKVCFDCCGAEDRRELLATGKGILYVTAKDGKYRVTNWPGTLDIPAYGHTGQAIQ